MHCAGTASTTTGPWNKRRQLYKTNEAIVILIAIVIAIIRLIAIVISMVILIAIVIAIARPYTDQ